jgi:hypothetical protein
MFERLGNRGAIALSQLLVAGTIVVGGAGVGVGLDQAGVFGGGDETVEVSLDAVSTFDCPDGGEVGEVHRGDRVLATGRDDSGGWIEIRDPRDLGARVWVNATYLVPDADLSGLDTRECEVLVAAATTTTLLVPFPGPQPDEGGGSTGGGGGGAPADTTGPTITNVGASPNHIWEQDGQGITCPPANPRQSVVSASASDPSGVASLTASWAFGSVNQTKNIPPPAQFGPFPAGTVSGNAPYDHPITITITARDNRGNTSTATTTVTLTSIAQCFI